MCVTIFWCECIHQWMRTRYRYMWRLYPALHCTVPWAGTRHCCSCYQSITQSRAGTANLKPVFATPPAPPPTYLSIISSPRNISMTNIYSRDGASGRTSPAPHLSCVKSCNQPAAFPPSVSHNLSCWKILTPNRFFTQNRLLGI